MLATPPALIIKGVLDLQTPQRGYSGKAVELLALEDVPGPGSRSWTLGPYPGSESIDSLRDFPK
jgi:hypothetical protein